MVTVVEQHVEELLKTQDKEWAKNLDEDRQLYSSTLAQVNEMVKGLEDDGCETEARTRDSTRKLKVLHRN